MKKVLKGIGIFLALIIIVGAIFYITKNESLPTGTKGDKAEALATKMAKVLNYKAYKKAEVLEWSFRDSHFYKWHKQQNIVEVSWDNNKVILNTKNPENSEVFVADKKTENQKLIQTATDFFNNDSFWLVAPYKIFDEGVERSIVNHNDKDALLITYTSGGSTPGDSYLWILDENGFPISYKMWTSIIPIGGIEASWSDWEKTEAGFQLPTKHKINLFGMELDMGNVKATNPKADALADKILEAINHKAYKNTHFIEWSFGGNRHFKWDKLKHIVDVSWDTIRVNLHPNNLEKSTVFFNKKQQEKADKKLVKRAWDIFNNDSFWLVAPHKLYDNGTIRNIENIDGKDALRITYTTGGTTPGDSYVWILDENYVPKSYTMYLKSQIDRGNTKGFSATWEEWFTTKSGALLPKNHTFGGGRKLSMGDVKAYN